MRTVLFVASGLLCTCAWQANAQSVSENSTAAVQTSADNSVPMGSSASAMPGVPTEVHAKTRQEVYEELVRSQKGSEAQWLQELYKGS